MAAFVGSRFKHLQADEMARILIIDDDVDTTRLLLEFLHDSGHEETRVAQSAAAGLEIATQFRPSIIFLDIELPDMSGYEVALLLRQHPELQKMRLIALTDNAEHPARERARTSGFERYLVKPLTTEAVSEALNTVS